MLLLPYKVCSDTALTPYCCQVECCQLSGHAVLCCAVLLNAWLGCAVLLYAGLCCAVLCCCMLGWAVLCCAGLCYAVLWNHSEDHLSSGQRTRRLGSSPVNVLQLLSPVMQSAVAVPAASFTRHNRMAMSAMAGNYVVLSSRTSRFAHSA